MATTTTKTTYTMDEDGNKTPKWRLEHSPSDKAGCQQASCKRSGVKIAKGELRIGTHTWFEAENKYIWFWRHWACATPHQIKGLQSMAGDATDNARENIPGYSHISTESQEQVRLALEEGKVVDKEFKDVREDLAKPFAEDEIRDAVGYKVEMTQRGAANCRGRDCAEKGIRIAKGELRLGIATLWGEEHESWKYKHWKCITQYDLGKIKGFYEDDAVDGYENLPEMFQTIILDAFKTGEIVEPPKVEPEPKVKKPRAPRKKKTNATDDDEAGDENFKEVSKTKGKGSKKRTAHAADGEVEPDEPAPKKKRASRAKKTAS